MQICRHLKSLVLISPAACVLMLALGGNLARTAEEGQPSDQVRELLKERLVIVAEIYEITLKEFQSGQISIDQVFQARISLLTAKLDLCETKEDRIRVHREMVKQAEDWLQVVTKLFAASQATRVDVLKAKAQLLEARIGLEKSATSK